MPVHERTWSRIEIPWWLLMGGMAAFLLGIVLFRHLGSSDGQHAALPDMAPPAPVVRALRHTNAAEPLGYQPRELLPQLKVATGPARAESAAPPDEVPM